MTQYINKDALVAEINRQHKILMQKNHIYGTQFILGFRQACRQIIDFIDTLEVKGEVLLTPEEIKKICTIYDNLNQERNCGTVLYNSDETFFNHVLMEYKAIAKKGE